MSLSQMGSSDILKTQYLADKGCGFIKLCVLTTSKNQPPLNAVLLGPVYVLRGCLVSQQQGRTPAYILATIKQCGLIVYESTLRNMNMRRGPLS